MIGVFLVIIDNFHTYEFGFTKINGFVPVTMSYTRNAKRGARCSPNETPRPCFCEADVPSCKRAPAAAGSNSFPGCSSAPLPWPVAGVLIEVAAAHHSVSNVDSE